MFRFFFNPSSYFLRKEKTKIGEFLTKFEELLLNALYIYLRVGFLFSLMMLGQILADRNHSEIWTKLYYVFYESVAGPVRIFLPFGGLIPLINYHGWIIFLDLVFIPLNFIIQLIICLSFSFFRAITRCDYSPKPTIDPMMAKLSSKF